MDATAARTLCIEARLENEKAVQRFLSDALSATDCPTKARKELRLALEELFVNVARYAYAPGSGIIEVAVGIACDGHGAKMVLRDCGTPFDPFARAVPEAPRTIEDAPVGGLGILMVKRLMDACAYRRVDGCNEVTVEKRWQ